VLLCILRPIQHSSTFSHRFTVIGFTKQVVPIGRCKPVNPARYQDPELGRTSLFTIAVEIRDWFNLPRELHEEFRRLAGLPKNVRSGNGKAATLVMFQPSAPAREPTAWIHAPSQPLMRSPLSRPKPRHLLAESAGFFGSGCPTGRPTGQITQPTSDWQVLFRQSFQPSTSIKLNSPANAVNAEFRVKTKYL
jgi:hypothetical protein